MKTYIVLIVAILLAPLILYGLVSRDSKGTHLNVRATGSSPVIPVRDLFAPNNSRSDFRVSLSGHWLAWRETGVWGQRILLAPVKNPASPQIVTEEPVRDLFFLGDGRLGLKMRIGTVAVPPKTPDRTNWGIVPPHRWVSPSWAKTTVQDVQPGSSGESAQAAVTISLRPDGPVDITYSLGDSQNASALTPRGEMFLRLVRGNEPDLSWGIEASSRFGRVFVVKRFAGQTLMGRRLIDLRRQTARELGESGIAPLVVGQPVNSDPVALTHGDGRQIQALLTRPEAGEKSGPLPTVIVVGSDGILANGWSGDMAPLFLANRGYAVLTLDIETLAPEHLDDFPEDPDAVLDTIAGAAEWLIEAQIADKDEIAVMGQGFDGTMALLALSRDPDLFKAAIAHSPVSDFVSQSSLPVALLPPPGAESRIANAWRIKRSIQHLNENGGRTALVARSPTSEINDITGPVLLTHGVDDAVVPVAQTKAYAAALARAGKSVETAYFTDEGHLYSDWRTQVRIARLTEQFLAKTLGGRDGRYDYIELIAKFFWLPQ